MSEIKLVETKNNRRLHIGSYFVDLNESDYQELIRIFSQFPSPQEVTISYEFLEWIVCDEDLVIMPTEKDGWIWFSSKDARINRISTEQLYKIFKQQ